MEILISLLLFITGAAIGSFLNVVITRSIDGEQWKTGRSHCDHCGTTLAWYDMIPVLSYALYRGRSRCCHRPLSLQHPVVETLTGTLFVWWYFVGYLFFRLVSHPGAFIQPVFWLIIGLILLGIFVTDLYYGLIPSLFVSTGVVLTVFYRLILAFTHVYQWIDLVYALGCAIAAWGFFYFLRVITHEKGMGDGDVVLAFFLGILLGWPKTPVALLASFVLGAAISLGLMAFHFKSMKSTIPFGPFMIVGAVISLLWSTPILGLMGY